MSGIVVGYGYVLKRTKVTSRVPAVFKFGESELLMHSMYVSTRSRTAVRFLSNCQTQATYHVCVPSSAPESACDTWTWVVQSRRDGVIIVTNVFFYVTHSWSTRLTVFFR
jgi:hypothetical protein